MRVDGTDFILTESELSGLASHLHPPANRFSLIPDSDLATDEVSAITTTFNKLSESDRSRLENVIYTLSAPLRLANLNYTIADELVSRQVLLWPAPPAEELIFLAGNGAELRAGVRSVFQIQTMIRSVLAAGDSLRHEPLNLSLSTLAVITLLAVLDQLRYARLHSQVFHEEPIDSFAVFELLARIEEAETEDFRWPLLFVEKVLPLEFISMFSEQDVIAGLQELIQAELVQALDDTSPATLYVLSSEGKVIADAVLHDVSKLLLSFSDILEDGEIGHDVMFFIRGSFSLFLFMMSGETGAITGMDGEQMQTFLKEVFVPPPEEAIAALSITEPVETPKPSDGKAVSATPVVESAKNQQPAQKISSGQGRVCPYCQHPISDGAKFCRNCGRPVVIEAMAAPQQPANIGRICPHCQQPVGKNAQFCRHCGKSLQN